MSERGQRERGSGPVWAAAPPATAPAPSRTSEGRDRVKVVVGGASGYVGRALTAALAADGHEVVALSRRPDVPVAGAAAVVAWSAAADALEGAQAVVNLAGASIAAPRWTEARKRAIRASRIDTTRALAEAIADCRRPPAAFVTASGVDYYGDRGDEVVDEGSPPGSSFLASVCVDWEAASAPAPARRVALRAGLVVGPGAPALRVMALPFRLFVGGPAGDGRQFFPWIALDDLVALYRLAIADDSLAGPVNAVAPGPLRQRDAARAIGDVLHRPARVATPAAVLRLALGEEADLILHGQRAVSRHLAGHGFRLPGLRAALAASFGV